MMVVFGYLRGAPRSGPGGGSASADSTVRLAAPSPVPLSVVSSTPSALILLHHLLHLLLLHLPLVVHGAESSFNRLSLGGGTSAAHFRWWWWWVGFLLPTSGSGGGGGRDFYCTLPVVVGGTSTAHLLWWWAGLLLPTSCGGGRDFCCPLPAVVGGTCTAHFLVVVGFKTHKLNV